MTYLDLPHAPPGEDVSGCAPLPSSGIKEAKYRHVDCDGTQEDLDSRSAMLHINHKYIRTKFIISQPILDLPSGGILFTTF